MRSKTHNSDAIPAGISDYIKKNFHEDYLTDISNVKNDKGIEFFYVDVTNQENVYHLKFNAQGQLIEKDIESVRYPDDEIEMGNFD